MSVFIYKISKSSEFDKGRKKMNFLTTNYRVFTLFIDSSLYKMMQTTNLNYV